MTIPSPGFGTYDLHGDEGVVAVRAAIEAGYRYVDTARMYENEAVVGEAIDRADVPREEAFVATKLGHFVEPDLTSTYIRESVEESRARLGVDTIDLLYVHWPYSYDAEEHAPVLDELVDEGSLRHVGVSNFTIDLVDETRRVLDAPILANQVEFHPLLQQLDLLDAMRERDVTLVAYSPLAQGKVFDVPELQAIADKHGVTPATVSLAWLGDLDGVVPIPKTSAPERARANLAATELRLDDEDHEQIRGIERTERLEDEPFVDWD